AGNRRIESTGNAVMDATFQSSDRGQSAVSGDIGGFAGPGRNRAWTRYDDVVCNCWGGSFACRRAILLRAMLRALLRSLLRTLLRTIAQQLIEQLAVID